MVTLPTSYEQKAARSIQAWKEREQDPVGRALELINWPMNRLAGTVFRAPGFNWVVDRSVGKLSGALSDLALWSVRPGAIFAEFQSRGLMVHRREQIYDYHLEDIDRVARGLSLKYLAAASGEGFAAGMTGVFGVPADIAATVTLNVRAIGEYATYYGVDLSVASEKIFALNVLELALVPEQKVKKAALSHLVGLARDAAVKRAASGLGPSAMGQLVKQFAETIGESLARTKIAQFIPVVGLAVGTVSNAALTRNVCAAAHHLYRERFLAAKYGPEWIAMVRENEPANEP